VGRIKRKHIPGPKGISARKGLSKGKKGEVGIGLGSDISKERTFEYNFDKGLVRSHRNCNKGSNMGSSFGSYSKGLEGHLCVRH